MLSLSNYLRSIRIIVFAMLKSEAVKQAKSKKRSNDEEDAKPPPAKKSRVPKTQTAKDKENVKRQSKTPALKDKEASKDLAVKDKETSKDSAAKDEIKPKPSAAKDKPKASASKDQPETTITTATATKSTPGGQIVEPPTSPRRELLLTPALTPTNTRAATAPPPATDPDI